jgi:integrase/recombinase XerD
MKRVANPSLSSSGEEAVAQYRQVLWEHEDLTDASRRNYLSDLRHFAAWYESHSTRGTDETSSSHMSFDPQAITTPALTRYRAYLQKDLHQKPNSVNRALISLKRYCGWAIQKQLISYDPSAPVKLVGEEEHAPRHLEDEEEQALVAAVTNEGTLRDRVLIVLLLHTGLRASEICQLRRDQVKLGKRSGTLEVIGKRNKYREVPLNVTARKALGEYLSTLSTDSISLFPSGKTKEALSERALGYIIKKYAERAKLVNVSPHDLRHRFGYRMAEAVPLHRLAQIMGHNSLDTTMIYVKATKRDLQKDVEKVAWV